MADYRIKAQNEARNNKPANSFNRINTILDDKNKKEKKKKNKL